MRGARPGGRARRIDEATKRRTEMTEGAGEPSPFQVSKKIEAALEEVRPALRADGGDLELVDIKGWKVYCRLTGACAGCMGAERTLKLLVENTLRERVDKRIEVIPV